MRKTRKKTKLSSQEKEQKRHKNMIISALSKCGMKRVADLCEKNVKFKDVESDIDDAFIYKNIFLLVEYTIAERPAVHLEHKNYLYERILKDEESKKSFIEYIKSIVSDNYKRDIDDYGTSTWIIKILYCSLNEVSAATKKKANKDIKYFDYYIASYFKLLSDAIEVSARWELFHFLDIKRKLIYEKGFISSADEIETVSGLSLPNTFSNFSDGYEIMSFYAAPDFILKTCYVLRRNGWKGGLNTYQRMISPKKIKDLRKHLKDKKRVFINNIIVTLPSDVTTEVKFGKNESEKSDGDVLPMPIKITIPVKSNSIGIVDGQHRVFSYHEALDDDKEISKLRRQQNLLITGIKFPCNVPLEEKQKFEARLFKEINSNQTSASAALKQEIERIIEPYAPSSIAMAVLDKLNQDGPLSGFIQINLFDKNKLKSASIVSFGLKPLVKLNGTDSLYSIWPNDNKEYLLKKQNNKIQGEREDTEFDKDESILMEYVKFCSDEINKLLNIIRESVTQNSGESKRYDWKCGKIKDRKILSTVTINGFLKLLGILIEKKKNFDDEKIKESLKELSEFEFSKYSSSHYKKMAEELFNEYFSTESKPN
ncbi:DGQHR domain-containing protein [Bartonella apis]|uniref:DGQHR domain-containing protein n=1 Tax=Bartonella apis TaxID=1686310 RepID=UPI002431B7DE|nr:DGQHR domain-containing protein [Bartonella apis]